MDLVSSCQEKLASFRLKELKDVLTQIGVSKQGKKQDLVERVLALLSDEAPNVRVSAKKKFIGKEAVAGIIDDAYRKLQAGGATSASTNGESFLDINDVKLKEEVANPVHLDKKIRCPCGSSLPTEYMIQCADQRCLVFQHISCVIIEEEYSEAIPPFPSRFYCEICRINRADPFWVTVGHLLSPVKLITANNPADGTTPLQIVEKTFQLTRTDIDLLQNMEYDVQAWCILLNDTVPFRMQWPLYADLKVNGVPVRTVNRPGSQLLGANGRDDGPMIAFYIGEEVNRISLSGCDARSFCLGVRLVNRCTIQQILNMIFEDQNGEPFEDALVRVRCCIGGGMAMANEDSDSDLEVIADSVTVNLRCPMSGSRIKTAGRFKPCAHMGCFDLETFVQLNQRSRKWQCPICLKNYSLEDITVDPYFNLITKMVQDCGDDVTEIEVKPDGSWRLKIGYQFKNLEQWHLPNGSIGVSGSEVDASLEASTHLEEEGTVGQSNPKQVTKPRDKQTANQLGEYFENDRQNIITMSSSSSESHRDDGDCSVNEDGIVHSDTSANNGNNINPVSYNMDTTDRNMNRNTDASLGDLDVIVLSDSEEENANFTSPETISTSQAVNYSGHSFPASRAPFNAYPEDPALDAGARSSLGNFRSNGNDLEMSHQAFCSGTRSNNVSEALIDPEYTAVTSSATTDVYTLTSKCSTDPCGQVFGSSVCQSNTGTNDSLVSNPLAFVCVDPPVQTIAGTRQPGLTMQSDPGNNPQTSNGVCGKNLTSFGLGSNDIGGNGAAGIHAEPATSTGMDLVNQLESNEALLPRSMDDEIRSNGKTKVKVSPGPFSFPRQPRSVRRRYLP